MVLDALVENLTLNLITNVDEEDPIRAYVVKKGLLLDNKSQKGIQVGVQGGDHELPDDEDGISTLEKLPKIAMYIPAREIGGTQIWMRRGVVRVEGFFLHTQTTEDEAHLYGYNLLGRVMQHIEDTPIQSLDPDSYNETIATQLYCYSNTFFESGGPPASFIFRGKVKWAFFTERP